MLADLIPSTEIKTTNHQLRHYYFGSMPGIPNHCVLEPRSIQEIYAHESIGIHVRMELMVRYNVSYMLFMD